MTVIPSENAQTRSVEFRAGPTVNKQVAQLWQRPRDAILTG